MPDYKYKFREPEYYEHSIQENGSGTVVGHLRVKPSRILWKPANGKKYYSKSIDAFEKWITSRDARATKTTQ
ncbi:MAG TPA: hypothetical protein VMB85_16920 [Bryobacteraceae bacterium]|nr:hypothetical protein [Bryobacteraceae bacterium]